MLNVVNRLSDKEEPTKLYSGIACIPSTKIKRAWSSRSAIAV